LPFLRKWIKTQNVIEAAEYFTIRVPKSIRWPEEIGKRPLRGKNRHITSEQQQKMNNRHAVLHFGRVMNNNFGPEDFFITNDLRDVPFLPNGEPDEDAVKDYIAKYTRKLRTCYRKAGATFKYLWVIEKETEQKKVRIHVHMLLPSFSADDVMSCWTFGGCTIRRLDCNNDYKGIANYLSKDPTLGVDHKKRWGGSKNLKQPDIPPPKKIQYPGGQIKPPKGYKLVVDRAYVSDITGLSRYVRFVRMGGADIAEPLFLNPRAGPAPIPWNQEQEDIIKQNFQQRRKNS
jgi:hypothetical protein